MKSLTLKRITENAYGMFGALFDSAFICTTLERNWLENQANISCIPPGKYVCRRGSWPKHKDTFQVLGVPGRDFILFHVGNYMRDSNGCILLGSGFAKINGQMAISNSGEAFTNFLNYFKGENEFELEVIAA